MKVLAVLFSLFVLQVQPAFAQEDARQFLRDIYLTYVEGDGDGISLEGPALRKAFVDSMADKIEADAKKGTARRLDYDPLVDAEMWEVTDLRIIVRAISPTAALANVSFLNFSESHMVNVDLTKTKAGWRIEDIQVPDGRLSALFEGPDPVPDVPISSESLTRPAESRAATQGAAPAAAPAAAPIAVKPASPAGVKR